MNRRTVPVGIAAFALAASMVVNAPVSSAAPTPTPPPLETRDTVHGGIDRASDSIIIIFDNSTPDPERSAERAVERALGDQAGIAAITPITNDTVAVRFDHDLTAAEATRVGERVEALPGVDTAEPAARFTTMTTNDTYYKSLWNLIAKSASRYGTKAEAAWTTANGAGTVVAVIDTGITAHTDLTRSTSSIVGGNVVAGYDFIEDPLSSGDGDGPDSDPTDAGGICEDEDEDENEDEEASWHGTHVSGIVAALAGNGVGVAGVAPGAKVQPLRVLGACGAAEADVISAVRWGAGLPVIGLPANPTPATVLNLSLGGPGQCSTAMQSAITAALAKGVPVVVAAGNDNVPAMGSFPANCRGVISVGASTFDGKLAKYSNYGSESSPLTILAPGGSGEPENDWNSWILSTYNDGRVNQGPENYVGMVGTSMAAPHAAGAIALMKDLNPKLSVAELTAIIKSTATAMPSPCTAARCGPGALNAQAAVAEVANRMLSAVKVPPIAGDLALGSTLTADASGVPGRATTSFSWLRDGTAIAGATGRSYVLAAADLGKPIRVRVKVTLGTAVRSVDSAAVTPPRPPSRPSPRLGTGFLTLEAPYASGVYKVGKTLQAHRGTVYPVPTKVSYRWLRNGSPIKGATSSKYKLKKADKRKKVSVRVTVSRSGYKAVSYTSSSQKVR